jgi:DNA transposition AAA+ family ATPase
MNPDEIKARLKIMRISQNQLARKWGELRPTVCMFINGHFKSARLQKKLAKTLGVSIQALRNGN